MNPARDAEHEPGVARRADRRRRGDVVFPRLVGRRLLDAIDMGGFRHLRGQCGAGRGGQSIAKTRMILSGYFTRYVFTSGSIQSNTALAQQAQLDLDAAIVALSSFGAGITIPFGDLDLYQSTNGGSITPGTYTVSAAAVNLSGTLILDGGNNPNAVWVFQLPSTLITSSTSNVVVQNIGTGANVGVYWNVHSAATLNGPTFAGNVLASDLISSDGDLTIGCGRLLSATKQVTLIQDHISITGCLSGGFDQGVDIGSGGTGGSNGQVVPEPATFALFGFGLAAVAASRRRRTPRGGRA